MNNIHPSKINTKNKTKKIVFNECHVMGLFSFSTYAYNTNIYLSNLFVQFRISPYVYAKMEQHKARLNCVDHIGGHTSMGRGVGVGKVVDSGARWYGGLGR